MQKATIVKQMAIVWTLCRCHTTYKGLETNGDQHSLLNPSSIMNTKVVFTSLALVVYIAACLVEVHGIGMLLEAVSSQI